MLAHPYLPSCDDCCAWQYDPKTWKRLGDTDRDRRDPGDPTPCWCCPKIPPGEEPCPATGRANELTDANWMAWLHYQRCRAVGKFPEDELVERNAGLIRMVEEQVARDRAGEPMTVLAAVLGRMSR